MKKDNIWKRRASTAKIIFRKINITKNIRDITKWTHILNAVIFLPFFTYSIHEAISFEEVCLSWRNIFFLKYGYSSFHRCVRLPYFALKLFISLRKTSFTFNTINSHWWSHFKGYIFGIPPSTIMIVQALKRGKLLTTNNSFLEKFLKKSQRSGHTK